MVSRMVTTQGQTADGLPVRVEGHDRYRSAQVWVDGIERTVVRASRQRDGGTTRYECEDGVLICPQRLNSDDRTPRWKPHPATPS